MHIVHLMASPFVGGPERQVLGLARHLPPVFRTSFLSFAERGLARPFLDTARRQGFDAAELRHNSPRLFACIAEVAAELRQRGADLLCCNGYKPDIIGWRAARRVGIPVVFISHGWTAASFKVRIYESLDRMASRRADAVVCVSQAQAVKVRNAKVPEDRLVVIANAISEEFFAAPDPSIRDVIVKMFPTPPRIVVGAAGRLSPEKNFAMFVEAAARISAQRADIGFVVFGEGPLRAALTEQIAQLGLRDRFLLAGFHADVGKYLPNLDLAVMSSTTEGLPVILLEACAAAVPMVATAVGGIPEVIVHGHSGYLVPSGDTSTFVARILDALRDDDTRRAMGRHAQDRVRRDFSCARQAAQYHELFARLGGKGSAPAAR